MSALTPRRVQLACAFVAGIIYIGTIGHGWAFDDGPIIASNPAAQSIPNALDAFFAPYWPGDETTSGQYRPLVILSYAVDWFVSGGSPAWFHFVNLVMHAITTALFVAVALAWLSPLASATAGLVFAVHPLHVEAVANVVGRAEVLVAMGVLACVLSARKYRTAETKRRRMIWLATLLVCLLGSLLVKEHAIIVVAVIALDEFLDRNFSLGRSIPLYIGVLAVSIGWLYLWRDIAGQFVALAEAATIRGLNTGQRLSTMFPAQLDVIRLLVWPLDLAADYNPQVIPRRTAWSLIATIGLVTSAAIVVLGFLVRRRAPAITFGILFAVISYAPTSNLLFASGIILAERNLYLAVVAPALVLGWLVGWGAQSLGAKRNVWRIAAMASVGGLLIVYSARTVARVPFWRDSDNVLLMDFAEHSENYRARLRLGGFYRTAGNLPAALTEAITAGEIFPEDPWVAQYSVVRALDLGLPHVALQQARKAHDTEPGHPSFARLIVRSFLAQGHPDSAAMVARRSIEDAPESPLAMWSYTQVLDSLGAPSWQKHFARSRFDYLEARLVAATAQLDSGLATVPERVATPNQCWELQQSVRFVRLMRSAELPRVRSVLENSRDLCPTVGTEPVAP